MPEEVAERFGESCPLCGRQLSALAVDLEAGPEKGAETLQGRNASRLMEGAQGRGSEEHKNDLHLPASNLSLLCYQQQVA